MADDQSNESYHDVHEQAAQYSRDEDEGFANYEETTVDPGPWLLIATISFCAFIMLIAVPLMVRIKMRARRKRRSEVEETEAEPELSYVHAGTESLDVLKQREAEEKERLERKKYRDTNMTSILGCDAETRAILSRAIPYTISGLASSSFSNICLAMVGHYVGTRAVAAYALVQILAGLTDGILYGPIYACTSLCSQAVGAGNSFLAGQYIQLAMIFYLLLNIPCVWFWWVYMEEVVLYLQWGDDETAALAEDFIRVYIWSYVLGGISSAVWELLEVADHVVEGTIVSILWGASNVLVISLLVTQRESSLFEVGLAYIFTAVFFIFFTYLLAECRGWLQPFRKGLFGSFAVCNWHAVRLMVGQAVPLSFGSIVSNAEWTVLTFFASQLGPAEVAAWAILGSIWDLFYACTSSIGDAAEIRVAHHFGQNEPEMAKLSAYKSLLLSMCVAAVVSVIYFTLQSEIPAWFTVDETLQAMLEELVPFVGVGNLTMQFGMSSWSIIGAMGKYKLATWVSFVSSWGITMPFAALFTIWLNIDLQGLTAAVVWGYVCTGAALSYVLLSTDWKKVAKKIQDENATTAAGEQVPPNEEDGDNAFYANMQVGRSQAARLAVRRNIRLLTIPSGARSGVMLGNIHNKRGTFILMVRNWSPLFGKVRPGDSILALDGQVLKGVTAHDVSGLLKATRNEERQLSIVSPPEAEAEAEPNFLFTAIAEDASTRSGMTE